MRNEYEQISRIYYVLCKTAFRLNPNDTSEDDAINAMAESEIFSRVCDWNGLLGYGDTIRVWIKDVFGKDLK